MGDHSLIDPDQPPTVIERKVTASTAVSLVASLGVALANGYAQAGMLDPLPKWAQFPILLILPPLASFCAGFLTPSNRV